MKIAIEAQRIFQKEMQQVDNSIFELIKALQKVDFSNEYFIIVKSGEGRIRLSETKNFHIVETRSASYPVWEQKILPSRLKEIEPDIVHCTSGTAPLHIDSPLVLTLRDVLFMKNNDLKLGGLNQRAENVYRKLVVPRAVKKSSKIITVSDFEKSEIIECFPFAENRVKTIYNAQGSHFKVISDVGTLIEYKVKFKLPDNFILCLTGTKPNDNLGNVLKQFKVLSQFEQTKIPIVIPNMKRRLLKEFLTDVDGISLLDHIHLIGEVSSEELVYLYNLANLCIYLPFYDSTGVFIMQSMSCGTPIVSSNRSAIPEVAAGAANLADPESPKNMSIAVLELICNGEIYNRCVEMGLNRALDFSWEASARRVLDVYDEIHEEIQFVKHL